MRERQMSCQSFFKDVGALAIRDRTIEKRSFGRTKVRFHVSFEDRAIPASEFQFSNFNQRAYWHLLPHSAHTNVDEGSAFFRRTYFSCSQQRTVFMENGVVLTFFIFFPGFFS